MSQIRQNKAMTFQVRFLLMVVCTVILTACNSNDFTDLQQYISSVKSRPKSTIKALPEFKDVEPFVFKSDGSLRDPFRPVEKTKIAEETEEEIEPDNGIHPDKNRVKEPLELFPLNGLKMVGIIDMNSTLWGLIKSDNNIIYRVKKGDYLGKNDGRITQIDKKKIELVEIMPSTPGRFIEQTATLMLTE
jgi:type IV pilus assembly protein PilP